MLFVQVSTKFCVDRRWIIPRVPECLSLRPNWLPLPHPPPASKCIPPWIQRGGNTRLRVRCRGEPIRTTVEKAWHSVYSVVWTILLYVGCSRCYHVLLCLSCVLFNITTMWKILLSLIAYSQNGALRYGGVITSVTGCKNTVHIGPQKSRPIYSHVSLPHPILYPLCHRAHKLDLTG